MIREKVKQADLLRGEAQNAEQERLMLQELEDRLKDWESNALTHEKHLKWLEEQELDAEKKMALLNTKANEILDDPDTSDKKKARDMKKLELKVQSLQREIVEKRQAVEDNRIDLDKEHQQLGELVNKIEKQIGAEKLNAFFQGPQYVDTPQQQPPLQERGDASHLGPEGDGFVERVETFNEGDDDARHRKGLSSGKF